MRVAAAVEGENRHARLFIHRIVYRRACVLRPPEAMLRGKDRRHVYAVLDERVENVLSIRDRVTLCVQAEVDEAGVLALCKFSDRRLPAIPP